MRLKSKNWDKKSKLCHDSECHNFDLLVCHNYDLLDLI